MSFYLLESASFTSDMSFTLSQNTPSPGSSNSHSPKSSYDQSTHLSCSRLSGLSLRQQVKSKSRGFEYVRLQPGQLKIPSKSSEEDKRGFTTSAKRVLETLPWTGASNRSSHSSATPVSFRRTSWEFIEAFSKHHNRRRRNKRYGSKCHFVYTWISVPTNSYLQDFLVLKLQRIFEYKRSNKTLGIFMKLFNNIQSAKEAAKNIDETRSSTNESLIEDADYDE